MRLIYLFLFWYLTSSSWVWAQDEVPTTPRARTFNEKKLAEYRQQDAFRYDRKAPPRSLTGWQRFWQWLDEWLDSTLDTPQKRSIWQWVLIGFSSLVILYLGLRLLKADVTGWLTGNAKTSKVHLITLGENIHEINFDAAIVEAIQQKQFRQAVRLYYLKTLKKMTDKQLITWEKDKTNRDYIFELRETNLLNAFQATTQVFEYIYYGDFRISQQEFTEAQSVFDNLDSELAKY